MHTSLFVIFLFFLCVFGENDAGVNRKLRETSFVVGCHNYEKTTMQLNSTTQISHFPLLDEYLLVSTFLRKVFAYHVKLQYLLFCS